MVNIELIFDRLKWVRVNPEYAGKALQMAEALSQAELKRFHGESSHDSKGPGLYPAARLLQAYALTMMRHYDEAQAIIDEEVRRQRPTYNEQMDFFFEHYQGLKAVITQNRGLEAVTAEDAPEDLTDLLTWEPFNNLLQDLTEKTYYLLRPASSVAYEMPQHAPPNQKS